MNEMNDKKDNKIIIFIIGVLMGAVIATASFLICVNAIGINKTSDTQSSQQMQGGTPPEMSSGNSSQNGQGGTPPEKPSDDNNSQNSN